MALKFRSVQIPALVQRGTNFWLSCQFEMDGQGDSGEQLYSVKWYKNNEEFYRLIAANNSATSTAINSNQYALIDANNQQGQPTSMQQQYFSQVGLNVMVSRERDEANFRPIDTSPSRLIDSFPPNQSN